MLDDPIARTPLNRAIEAYSYLDLEVDSEGEIYRFGFVSPTDSCDVDAAQADQVRSRLLHLCQTNGGLCGHNIRRFDYPHLIRRWPELEPLSVIDTLELSVLAFPLQPSHQLQKDYKLSQYASNNPLEDAQATQLLLQQILQSLSEQPEALLQTYSWLLTCGGEAADRAYQPLFQTLGWLVEQPPRLEWLPEGTIAQMHQSYLEHLWRQAKDLSFDDRLSVAALLAWNHARHRTDARRSPSAWLTHLPSWHTHLEALFPVVAEGFTYQPYLQEFEVPGFRPYQEAAVQAILDGKRPLIVMATGGGKSLCYQLPALMFYRRQQGLTVCISPLQALMEDQVADLETAGLDFATFINGMLSAEERSQRLEQLRDGWKGLLYISPEQLRSPSIRALLHERPPVLWIIDEAHCISQWGHDFRPDYRYIPKFIQDLYAERQCPLPRLALLTATATAVVREDMQQLFAQQQLDIRQAIMANMSRENLDYQVIPVQGNKDAPLLNTVRQALEREGCVLVYTTTRREAERLATLLNQNGMTACAYHGKLSRQDKNDVLHAFKQGDLNVVTATCAFGMGINRKDVRAVIHHTMSSSLESYTQEAGRAGRDGLPACCTLLFDEQDADPIFFLRSLNQLSDTDLRNLFLAVRSLRDRIHKTDRVSEDWFWVTPDELFQISDLDEKFASEDEQRDTKIKVALHHLEQFQLIERAENLSSVVQFSLVQTNPQASCHQFELYSRNHQLSEVQVEQFRRLIYAMHLAKAHCQQQDEPFPLERLSDASGIPVQELSDRIRELQQAGVCSSKIPLTLLITKGVRGDARNEHDRLRALEQDLLEELLPLLGDRPSVQVNLRGLATRLDPDRQRRVSATTLLNLLEGWQSLKWVRLHRVSAGIVRLENLDVINWLSRHQELCRTLLEMLYQQIGTRTGTQLRLEYDLGNLLQAVQQRTHPLSWTEIDLKKGLLWLHQRKILRLTDGLNLFHQALRVRVFRGARITTINRRYPELQEHYRQQARRTHLMLEYGRAADDAVRQQLIVDYFSLSPQEFATAYPHLNSDALDRPVTQADYDRIMQPLNPMQQAIVTAEHAAMGVIAGPGSGKTRTIVHRIAYLVKVKRVHPDRILVLAYNRNAVRELRLRLQGLMGPLAANLRVLTFHGLALSLLGRTFGQDWQTQRRNELNFEQLLKESCRLLEQGDESDETDQIRRVQLLGNLEHIFVDEYQDVAEDEYRLIQLIAGLGQSEDTARSVQINLCAIGDDDQNIYEFRNTSSRYILQFETEYNAERLLLTENYRSTEPIIAAANALIQQNQQRCKRSPDDQVRINSERQGQGGLPVLSWQFHHAAAQAGWICECIQSWLQQGMAANEIAVLARQWELLSPVRALLEQAGIPTYALKNESIPFVRNWVTVRLITALKAERDRLFSAQESVQDWFRQQFQQWQRPMQEPTVQTLLKMASDLDQERGYGSEALAVAISTDEILTALFEFNQSGEAFLQENSVLVTSSHGAKGLEFRAVILLTDGFSDRSHELEAERRLFYVAMTRAKEQLVLCSTQTSRFVEETQVQHQVLEQDDRALPRQLLYLDLTPGDVNLGHRDTRQHQNVIQTLREGEPLRLVANAWKTGWEIQTPTGTGIGALSKAAVTRLQQRQIVPNAFHFQSNEVTVRYIYRHLKIDEITAEILEDWFVVIPQIRLCRYSATRSD